MPAQTDTRAASWPLVVDILADFGRRWQQLDTAGDGLSTTAQPDGDSATRVSNGDYPLRPERPT